VGRQNKVLLYGLTSLVICLLISCGIDTLNYLGPTVMPTLISQSPSGLIFSGPENPPIPPYSGINIYYRIYASETEANNDKARLEQRQSSDTIPGSSVPYFLEPTLGYARPARNTSSAPPTIPSSFDSDSIRIDLIEGRLYLQIGASESFELQRNLRGILRDFSIIPLDEDSDFNKIIPPTETEPGPLHVQFFAASYGFDFLGSNPELYSNAVFLGRIVLTDTN